MIEQWQKGEPITATRLNGMADQSNALNAEVFGRAGTRRLSPNSVPFPVTVVTVFDDHLVCRPLGVTAASANIFVAKPWGLRKTPFHGKTIPNHEAVLLSYNYTGVQARTVTDTTDDSTEDQVIVPAYVPAQTIEEVAYTGTQITVQRVAFGPGVSFTGSGNMTVEVEFEDMNRAGRAWAEVNT